MKRNDRLFAESWYETGFRRNHKGFAADKVTEYLISKDFTFMISLENITTAKTYSIPAKASCINQSFWHDYLLKLFGNSQTI